MRTNASVEYHASVYRDLDRATAATARAARAELPCSECGGGFLMCGGWDREAVSAWIGSDVIQFYRCQWDDHELYRPCRQCNPNLIIPHLDFAPLTPEQVAAWLARECQCTDCKRERGKEND